MAQEQLEQQTQPTNVETSIEPTETEAPKGTALILGMYAVLIGVLWGLMYFDLILRR